MFLQMFRYNMGLKKEEYEAFQESKINTTEESITKTFLT